MGWIVVPNTLSPSSNLLPVNVILFGKRSLQMYMYMYIADVSEGSWDKFILDLCWALNPMTIILMRIKHKGFEIQRYRGKDMWRQWQRLALCANKSKDTKDCQEPPEARIEAWDRFSLRTFRRNRCYGYIYV